MYGNWSYMDFTEAYPGGPQPVLAPTIFDSEGFPVLQDINTSPKSVTTSLTTVVLESLSGKDTFSGLALGPE
jgi:hypothetical protein